MVKRVQGDAGPQVMVKRGLPEHGDLDGQMVSNAQLGAGVPKVKAVQQVAGYLGSEVVVERRKKEAKTLINRFRPKIGRQLPQNRCR